MDIKDKSRNVLKRLFNELAGAPGGVPENDLLVDAALEELKKEGFEVALPDDGFGPFIIYGLTNPETLEEVAIIAPRGVYMIDDEGNEIFPMIYRSDGEEGEFTTDFLADFVAEKRWQETEKSTGYKFQLPF